MNSLFTRTCASRDGYNSLGIELSALSMQRMAASIDPSQPTLGESALRQQADVEHIVRPPSTIDRGGPLPRIALYRRLSICRW